jgi:hypothetical protein
LCNFGIVNTVGNTGVFNTEPFLLRRFMRVGRICDLIE